MALVECGIIVLFFLFGITIGLALHNNKCIDFLESSCRALWGAVNRIGDENDKLRSRIARLERKADGEQHESD